MGVLVLYWLPNSKFPYSLRPENMSGLDPRGQSKVRFAEGAGQSILGSISTSGLQVTRPYMLHATYYSTMPQHRWPTYSAPNDYTRRNTSNELQWQIDGSTCTIG